MKKVKFGISFLLLIIVCVVIGNFLLLINYLLALTLHELAHLFVATKYGYSLKQFNINIFGVSIELNEKISDKDCFAINIAGPIFNLMLCVMCLALYWLIPATFNYLNLFCISNLVLAVFNLIPVYPLDGGKIFRSMFSSTKKYKKLDFVVRSGFAVLFLCLFVLSIFVQV